MPSGYGNERSDGLVMVLPHGSVRLAGQVMGYGTVMSEVDRAQRAASAPDNAAERDRNQRRGVDEDAPAQTTETDPTDTDHPTGEAQARKSAENEPPG